jgi:hypothetical protein
MYGHHDCDRCKRLIDEWHSATSAFSESVSRLRDSHHTGNGFAQAHRETEMARLAAENARTTLELHRGEPA